MARSGLDRSEVFVTSKLNNGFHRPDDARRAFAATLDALGFDYVDLFLIHWPLPTLYGGDFVSTWNTLIEFHRDGRARSIGVSNFQPHHLDRLRDETDVVPAVNQIEIHPYLTQDGASGVRPPPRDRHRSLVPDRPGHASSTTRPSPRWRTGSGAPRPRWCSVGTSSGGTSSSPSR